VQAWERKESYVCSTFRASFQTAGELWPYRNYVPFALKAWSSCCGKSLVWNLYPVRHGLVMKLLRFGWAELCRSTYNFDTSGTNLPLTHQRSGESSSEATILIWFVSAVRRITIELELLTVFLCTDRGTVIYELSCRLCSMMILHSCPRRTSSHSFAGASSSVPWLS
jgi:hypothetical protein